MKKSDDLVSSFRFGGPIYTTHLLCCGSWHAILQMIAMRKSWGTTEVLQLTSYIDMNYDL